MSNFKLFQTAIKSQVDKMCASGQPLFVVDAPKELVYEQYLDAFPAGTNPVYRERREYDCNCCKHFIRDMGNVVAITMQNELVSIWDVEVPYPFDVVAKKLSELIKSSAIANQFLHFQKNVGQKSTRELDGTTVIANWDHFYAILPAQYVSNDIPRTIGELRETRNVFKRAMEELTMDSYDTVLDLISQNSLYRGAEFKHLITGLKEFKVACNKVPSNKKETFYWRQASIQNTVVLRARNTAIGTLLVDLSEGMDLEQAVAKYERIMAPANYRRPTALVTKTMIDQAQKTVEEEGLVDSLPRRYATIDDITVPNTLFVNRDVKKLITNVFDTLKDETAVNPRTFDKIEEISIDKFISDVLPRTNKLSLLFERKHFSNLVSLIAPVNKQAPGLFKWDNNFSWTYKGEVADAMKERVKAAGGNVDGVLRFSIQWNEDGNSICDLDAHAYEPNRTHIGYDTDYRKDQDNMRTTMSGQLDVDMINPRGVGVENIAWTDLNKMKPGDYKFEINNFNNKRNNGFIAQVEFNGEIHKFAYSGNFQGRMTIATVNYNLSTGFSIKANMPKTNSVPPSAEEWGITTNQFQEVHIMMYSPNYWDGQNGIGNKHYFFMLKDCKSPDTARGFYNEFLKDSLTKHRKTFEVLGSKLKAEPTDEQLSGVGFSSTNKNSVVVKVEGPALVRTLKINF